MHLLLGTGKRRETPDPTPFLPMEGAGLSLPSFMLYCVVPPSIDPPQILHLSLAEELAAWGGALGGAGRVTQFSWVSRMHRRYLC